jgi:hypothetical protein
MRNDNAVIDILDQHRRERRIAVSVFLVLLFVLGGVRVNLQLAASPDISAETVATP